ncbi:leucine-rich repeat domain-containing protein [Flavilitoribacter nigricans]|nr:leucine-rich repeat domain-containing protein [Flavilitoribacter nigricans]
MPFKFYPLILFALLVQIDLVAQSSSYKNYIEEANDSRKNGKYNKALDNYLKARKVYENRTAGNEAQREEKTKKLETVDLLIRETGEIMDSVRNSKDKAVKQMQKKLNVTEKKYEQAQKTIATKASELNQLKVSHELSPSMGVALTANADSIYFLDNPERRYKIVNNMAALDTNTIALDLRGADKDLDINKVLDYKSLKILLLSGIGLTVIPETISQLKELEVLDLSNNELKKLPEAIAKLQKLETLILHHNLLEANAISEAIGQLKALQTLDLSDNSLDQLPGAIEELDDLKHLFLGFNEFREVPESIYQLEQLQTLDLTYNNLSGISDEMTNLTNLHTLLLENNLFKDRNDAFCKLFKLEKLNKLSISQRSATP